MDFKWTIFILDYDGTYDNEEDDTYGIRPMAYLIPEENVDEVKDYANKAHNDFHDGDSCDCIGDFFESYLTENGIDYREIGELDLLFEERTGDYLSENIAMEIV